MCFCKFLCVRHLFYGTALTLNTRSPQQYRIPSKSSRALNTLEHFRRLSNTLACPQHVGVPYNLTHDHSREQELNEALVRALSDSES